MMPLKPALNRGGWLVALTGLLLSGCGGGSAPVATAPPAAPPPPPAPKAVAVAPANPPPAAAPRNDEGEAAAPQKPVIVNLFPEEDPKNVFLLESDGARMTGRPEPAYSPSDQFAVAFGQPESDSSKFRVTAALPAPTGSLRADFRLPEGFQIVPSAGISSDGYPLRIRSMADQKEMAYVPAGSAKVGSVSGPETTRPEFLTLLNPYYMDVTEVTVGEFEAYRQSQRNGKKRVPAPPANAQASSDFPALGIAWGDASNYARWANKELPTEAEFERAARGNDGFEHPWGPGRAVWPTVREISTITPVALFRGDCSPFGIYDLAGNAREWTQDWYSPTSHQEAANMAAAKTLTSWTGPKKAAQGSQRVIKGAGPEWQVWQRWGADMHERLPDVGFRCVLRISPTAVAAASN